MAERRSKTVGIDFGTSTTLVAERTGQALPVVLPIGEATSWMPSLLGVGEDGRLVAGEEAARLGPRRVIGSIKSALTEGLDEITTPAGTIDVREGVRTLLKTALERAKAVDPDLLRDAEVFMGCPALWTGRERKLLVSVAHECGLDLDIGQVIDEPVAAGLHWVNSQWLNAGSRPTGKSLIFDAGGGTLDVAYLDVAGLEDPVMTVLSAEGRHESGDALDESIVAHLASALAHDRSDETFDTLLRNAARNLKEALSFETSSTVPVGAPYDAVVSLDRDGLEDVFDDQLRRAMRLVQSAVRGGLLRVQQPESPVDIRGRGWSELSDEIRHVALVGGLSYVPVVARSMSELFPKSSVTLVDRPQESVVRGLVYGDSLDELNLPRPPVDFYVEYLGLADKIDPQWLEEHQLVYEAFSPLYSVDELMRGNTHLGFVGEIPVPPGVRGSFEFVIRCVMPDRSRTPLTMRFVGFNGSQSGLADGIRLLHQNGKRAWLKLYTNGEFVVNSDGRRFNARVDKWPRLRGPHHDFGHEIRIVMGAGRESEYHRPFDNWRAK